MKNFETENFLSGFLSFFPKIVLYLIGWSLLNTGVLFLLGINLKNPFPVIFITLSISITQIIWEYIQLWKVPYKQVLFYLIISLGIISLSTFFVGRIYDKSWDGMTYHQIAILKISEGWNPVYEVLPYEEQSSKYFDRQIIINRWVNHYAKGLEIFSALMMGITNNIESGKVFNLLLLFASFCISLKLLISLKKISPVWCILIAVAASFNPITVNQIFSYYLDGAVGSLLLIMTVILFSMLWDNSYRNVVSSLFTSFFVLIIIINLKFTAFVYAGFFCFSFLLILLIKKEIILFKKVFFSFTTAGILAVGVAGFNPYITNTVNFNHPFHPLAGKQKVDIISINIPTELLKSNPLDKFLSSLFAESSNFDNRKEERIKHKYPFTFSLSEIKAFQSEGIRLGGFGILWSGIMILTLGLFILVFRSIKVNARFYLILVSLFILLSVAINPESWWARYVPQLWMFPIIILLFALYFSSEKLNHHIVKLLVVLMILNSSVVLTIYAYSAIKTSLVAEAEFRKLQNSKIPVPVYFDIFSPNERKLSSLNIPYVKVDKPEDLPCSQSFKVLKMEYCR